LKALIYQFESTRMNRKQGSVRKLTTIIC